MHVTAINEKRGYEFEEEWKGVYRKTVEAKGKGEMVLLNYNIRKQYDTD